jgi:hypothetical protein
MDQIDRAVVLPSRARPSNEYGKNFALSGAERVKAVYLIPEPLPKANFTCVHGDLKPCTKDEIDRWVSVRITRRVGYAPAGQRRWFDAERDLPSIADGGCNQVTIQYDMPTQRVISVGCNGR